MNDTPVIVGITPRVQEIGRIRMGDKNDRDLPVSLSTFRLTSYNKGVLDVAAETYGGTVRPWTDAPTPGMFEVVTAAKAIDVVFPRSLQSVTQAWELWTGGVCERRCDGVTNQPSAGVEGTPCVCGDQRGEDGMCDIITRLSVILPRLPGLGLWRLDTGGFNAATTIPSTLKLLMTIDERAMVPATLRAVERASKVRLADGKVITRRFIMAVLDAPGLGAIGDALGIESGDPAPVPEAVPARAMTAAERVAARRATHAAGSDPATHAPEVKDEASGAPDAAPGTGPEPCAGVDAGAAQAPAPPAVKTCGSPSPYEGDEGQPGGTCTRDAGHPRGVMCTDGSATWERPKDWA
jgi:hypothetical protein